MYVVSVSVIVIYAEKGCVRCDSNVRSCLGLEREMIEMSCAELAGMRVFYFARVVHHADFYFFWKAVNTGRFSWKVIIMGSQLRPVSHLSGPIMSVTRSMFAKRLSLHRWP